MALLDIFKRSSTKKTDVSYGLVSMMQSQEKSDNELSLLTAADRSYEATGDLNKRIHTYENVLSKKTEWNSFNHCMSLAQMYVKAGRNNDAWRYLNQIAMWFSDPKGPQGDISKIRQLQFKILKNEKKYKDAFCTLVAAYAIRSYSATQFAYFNKSKFIKEIKTTAKAIGMTEDQLILFSDEFERQMQRTRLDETKAREFCVKYFKSVQV